MLPYATNMLNANLECIPREIIISRLTLSDLRRRRRSYLVIDGGGSGIPWCTFKQVSPELWRI